MKRIFMVLGLVAVLGIGSAFVYADGGSVKEDGDWNKNNSTAYEGMEEWHRHRMEDRRENLNKAVKEGKISEEDSKTWEEHYNYMDEFHKENGFMANSGRGCHGRNGSGMMGHRRGY